MGEDVSKWMDGISQMDDGYFSILLFSRPCYGEIGGFCCERFSVFNFFFCLKFRSMEACSNWLDSVQNR